MSKYLMEAWFNLMSSKLRSMLAIIGIVVGSASVVALLSCSSIATEHALESVKRLGTDVFSLSFYNASNQRGPGNELRIQDLERLHTSWHDVSAVVPYIRSYIDVSYGSHQQASPLFGVHSDFFDIAKLGLVEGRPISTLDASQYYAVIGPDVVRALHFISAEDAIGKQISLGVNTVTVVGVLAPEPFQFMLGQETNNALIVPYDAAFLLDDSAQLHDVVFRVSEAGQVEKVQEQVKKILSRQFREARISIRSPEQIIRIVKRQTQTFSWLLGMIGAVSLLVGGIGVMNIMLVSVVERRKEIGIRMAVGATQKDIRFMFLVEALVLTSIGGFLGVCIGVVISYVFALVAGWSFIFFMFPLILGFGVTFIMGIISGYYPAKKASEVDPIATLYGL